MSEYQHVHFIAVDRPLTDEQLTFMQRQSTRATVTRREFTNEYHFGDFRGNTLEMMRRGFDLHLHFADFGIRKLMFRLPDGFPGGEEILTPYLIRGNLEWKRDEDGPGGVLFIHPDSEGGRWDSYFSDLEDLLSQLIPVREMLLNGDLRPLYLAWLACEPFEGTEPPVPAGMRTLPESLRLLANFYEICDDLLRVVETESEPCEELVSRPLPVQSWLLKKTEEQRLQLLESLLTDSSGQVQADALKSIRKMVGSLLWPTRQTLRTVEELYRLAEELSEERERRENEAKEKLRQKRLAGMAADPAATVARVTTLIEMRSRAKYSEAVALLCELRDALGPDSGPEFTSSVAAELRNTFPRTNGLVAELRKHGFLSK